MVVKMKSASNMIAKWYQKPSTISPPPPRAKICAIPNAKEGAPPVRLKSVISPTLFASAAIWFVLATVMVRNVRGVR